MKKSLTIDLTSLSKKHRTPIDLTYFSQKYRLPIEWTSFSNKHKLTIDLTFLLRIIDFFYITNYANLAIF